MFVRKGTEVSVPRLIDMTTPRVMSPQLRKPSIDPHAQVRCTLRNWGRPPVVSCLSGSQGILRGVTDRQADFILFAMIGLLSVAGLMMVGVVWFLFSELI